MKNKVIPFISIILSTVFWGSAGVFSQYLKNMGFSSSQASAFRMISSALLLMIILLIKDVKLYRIKLKNLPLIGCIGIISLFATSCLYLNAISASSFSTAAILMYTAPFIVTVAAVFLYKEKLTLQKIIALILAFIGCILVSGSGKVATLGVILGLLSGVTYASYSLFCKTALKSMSNFTISLYGFMFAAVASLLSIDLDKTARMIAADYKVLLLALAMGLCSSVIPYLLYSYGLKYIPAGNASIIAMLEPIIATIFGFVFFQDAPPPFSVLGIALIVFAVILIEIKVKKHEPSNK